jgi:cobalt-precorrin 5A hydrolase
MTALIAGLGCRKGASVDALTGVVTLALHRASQRQNDLVLLAVPAFKEDATFAMAASRLGVPLVYVDQPALAGVQERCLTKSPVTERLIGLGAIAEAAALVAAGPGATLLGPRIASNGVTCAIARRAS